MQIRYQTNSQVDFDQMSEIINASDFYAEENETMKFFSFDCEDQADGDALELVLENLICEIDGYWESI